MSEIRRIIRAFTPAEFELFVALGGVAKEPRNWPACAWHPVERWPGRSKAAGPEVGVRRLKARRRRKPKRRRMVGIAA